MTANFLPPTIFNAFNQPHPWISQRCHVRLQRMNKGNHWVEENGRSQLMSHCGTKWFLSITRWCISYKIWNTNSHNQLNINNLPCFNPDITIYAKLAINRLVHDTNIPALLYISTLNVIQSIRIRKTKSTSTAVVQKSKSDEDLNQGIRYKKNINRLESGGYDYNGH